MLDIIKILESPTSNSISDSILNIFAINSVKPNSDFTLNGEINYNNCGDGCNHPNEIIQIPITCTNDLK